jgi:hypothetical protein
MGKFPIRVREVNGITINGHIEMHISNTVPEQRTYEWVGGNVAEIDPYALTETKPRDAIGKSFQWQQFRVHVLDYDIYRHSLIVMRDVRFARFRAARFTIKRSVANFGHRLLLTARIWGLASWDYSAVNPSWRDLHIVRAVRRLLSRKVA